MLYNNFTEKLIDLQGVEVKNIETTDTSINIFLILKRKKHKCISCGCETDTVHDYRTQSVKDIPAFGKNGQYHSAQTQIQVSDVWQKIC